MDAKYDQDVLKAYAQVLYSKAGWMAWTSLAKGILLGLVMPVGILAFIGAVSPVAATLTAIGVRAADVQGLFVILPVVMGFRGWHKGKAAGWQLRLEAQRVLCQVQIEENTRKG